MTRFYDWLHNFQPDCSKTPVLQNLLSMSSSHPHQTRIYSTRHRQPIDTAPSGIIRRPIAANMRYSNPASKNYSL